MYAEVERWAERVRISIAVRELEVFRRGLEELLDTLKTGDFVSQVETMCQSGHAPRWLPAYRKNSGLHYRDELQSGLMRLYASDRLTADQKVQVQAEFLAARIDRECTSLQKATEKLLASGLPETVLVEVCTAVNLVLESLIESVTGLPQASLRSQERWDSQNWSPHSMASLA
jgi:hypothetical protein